MQNIKNVIFDLGGVLLKVDYKASEAAFAQMGLNNYQEYFKQDYSSALFEQLESGAITDLQFYEGFRATFKTDASNATIKDAWNAMIGDFVPENLHLLQSVTQKYKVYLFSNTNQIHYNCFHAKYAKQFGHNDFDKHFIKAYYSQICGWRKPNPQAYSNLLEAEGLIASETLFIDDTLKNITGAQEAGLQTVHLTNISLLNNINL